MLNSAAMLGNCATPAVDWNHLHFLLVEDNEDHQRLMSAVLRARRATVAFVERGEDAVTMVEASFATSRPFDIILMDIRLPTIDGYETTRRIRAAGYTGPVVAITAGVMEEELGECERSGCDACVRKPFDCATLCETLGEFLPRTVTPAQPD
jgi:CheY-like chemotaxis protein